LVVRMTSRKTPYTQRTKEYKIVKQTGITKGA
jgi:hypothetical protein